MLSEINPTQFASHRKSFEISKLNISSQSVADFLEYRGFEFTERIFTPFITLFAFLSQVFSDDSSGRRAVINVLRTKGTINPEVSADLWEELRDLILTQKAGKRPNRYEPRAIKNRKKNYSFLNQSRKAAKTKLHKKFKVTSKR